MTSPTPEPGLQVQLVRGLIDLLVALGPDVLTYRDDAAYGLDYGRPAAFIGSWPSAPDRVACFTPYPVSDDPAEPMSVVGVQVRTRWAGSNVRAVMSYSDTLYGELHGLHDLTLSTGVSISQCLRRSSTTMGQEAAGTKRWSWSDNYYVDVHWPSTHRNGS